MSEEKKVKPGWKTTEFWFAVFHQVPTILAIALGASNPVTLGLGAAMGVASALHNKSRTEIKTAKEDK